MSALLDPIPVETPLAIAVLCGGNSSRMRTDKSFLPLRGRPTIEHTLSRLEVLRCTHAAVPMLIITNNVPAYAYLGLPTLTDMRPGCGSLGGL